MTEYRIQFISHRWIITDDQGNPVDTGQARLLIDSLIRTYDFKRKCSVYVARSMKTSYYKIGISRNVAQRMSQLGTILKLEMVCSNAEVAWEREHILHELFTVLGKHVEREWFDLKVADLEMLEAIAGKCVLEGDVPWWWDIVASAVKGGSEQNLNFALRMAVLGAETTPKPDRKTGE